MDHKEFVANLEELAMRDVQVDLVIDLLSGEASPLENESVVKYISQCYNQPSDEHLLKLALIDVLDLPGDAEFNEEYGLEHLETGDMYAPTFIWYENEVYMTGYADALEALENGATIPGKFDIEKIKEEHYKKFQLPKESDSFPSL